MVASRRVGTVRIDTAVLIAPNPEAAVNAFDGDASTLTQRG